MDIGIIIVVVFGILLGMIIGAAAAGVGKNAKTEKLEPVPTEWALEIMTGKAGLARQDAVAVFNELKRHNIVFRHGEV